MKRNHLSRLPLSAKSSPVNLFGNAFAGLGRALLFVPLAVMGAAWNAAAAQPSHPFSSAPKPAHATVAADYGKLPLSFEANQGQSDPQVKFLARGNGYSLFLTDSAAVLALTKDNPSSAKPNLRLAAGKTSKPEAPAAKTDVVRMELAGANPGLRVAGADQLVGKANYFIGNDPSKWRSNVPTYAQVKYTGVYPGVDLVYYGNQRQLEYDFVVAPGASPKPVQLHFAGSSKLKLNTDGDLTVIAKDGEIAFHKPVVYQTKDGQRQPVEGDFTLLAGNTVGFHLGAYDHDRELVIDPVLAYSTYLGGTLSGEVRGIAVDGAGDAYLTGGTHGGFPVTAGAFQQTSPNGGVFVTELNPAGSALIYSTYLGGNGFDMGYGIQVDQSGDAYVTGSTSSTDFPVTEGAYQVENRAGAEGTNSFVTKLNSTGSALGYSSYLGGTGSNSATAIVVDSAGRAFVTGSTAPGFPVTGGAFQQSASAQSSFVTEFNATGSDLVYSTYLGEAANAAAIAVDSSDNAYVTGSVFIDTSGNIPVTTGAFQRTAQNSIITGFVTKFNATGSALAYSTYLGGNGGGGNGDYPHGIAVDTLGNAYIAGYTFSTNFPVTSGAFQQVNNATGLDNSTIFVTKLNSAGSGLEYSTYLGGNGDNGALAIALDSSDDAYITGYAQESGFPTTPDAYQTALGPSASANVPAFFTEFNPAGSALIYSTLFGGVTTAVFPYGIAVDSLNNAYIAGYVSTNFEFASTDLPTTPGAFQSTNPLSDQSEANTGFVAKFAHNGEPGPHMHQTITFPAIPPQTATASALLTATSSAPLPVTFASATPTICTVSNYDNATFLTSGYCNILVTQAGNNEYFPKTTGQFILVHHANQAIDFPRIAPQVAPGSVTLAATATITGLPVTFTSTTPAVCTVSGNTATLLIPGSCTIKASVAGNATYWADITGQTFIVQPAK